VKLLFFACVHQPERFSFESDASWAKKSDALLAQLSSRDL